jgi:hypothetical protein
MSDYGCVNSNNELVDQGSPIDSNGSKMNQVILQSEVVFTVIFAVEFGLKATGLGLFGAGSYFEDPWNWLDFVVVFFALFSYYPGIPDVSVFRTFRVLRPLKSVKSFPALASIVTVLMHSLVAMRDIFIVVVFMFLVFSIAGLQLFGGPWMHTRCRYTPYPVTLDWSLDATNTTGYDLAAYRCLDAPNFGFPNEEPLLTKQSSPWHTPQPGRN